MTNKIIISIALILFSNLSLAKTINVFVGIQPQKTFVEKIGGDRVSVNAVVPKGYSPELYDPTPKKVAQLENSMMYVTSGMPFERVWLKTITSNNPNIYIVDGLKGINLREIEEHSHHDDDDDDEHHGKKHSRKNKHDDDDEHHGKKHSRKNKHDGDDEHHGKKHSRKNKHDDDDEHHGKKHSRKNKHDDDDEHHGKKHSRKNKHDDELDIHVWTSPETAKIILKNILNALVKLDPDSASYYKNRYKKYIKELTKLDENIKDIFKGVKNKSFLVFHPTWGYFADRYGLKQIAIEHQGKEPNTADLAKIIEEIKENNISAILLQPQFSKKTTQYLSDSMGIKAITVDPLSTDYIDNLLKVSQSLAKTLNK